MTLPYNYVWRSTRNTVLPWTGQVGRLGGESLFASLRISHTGNTVSSLRTAYRPARTKYKPLEPGIALRVYQYTNASVSYSVAYINHNVVQPQLATTWQLSRAVSINT